MTTKMNLLTIRNPALAILILVSLSTSMMAQETNYDESRVPEFTLPDVLGCLDGTPVTTREQWLEQRRPEILKLFQEHVYGTMPALDSALNSFAVSRTSESEIECAVGDGPESIQVRLRQVSIQQGNVTLNLAIFLPIERGASFPVFLGCNFGGNHTVTDHAAVHLNPTWNPDGEQVLPDESTRGTRSGRWPIGKIVQQGFALATVYYGDIDPDFDDGFQNGVHGLMPELQNRPDNWSTIGGWAWGLHRVADYLEQETEIDANSIVLLGHSRLGKTALWAGATDPRFAIVISNNSGCGGAALARRQYGETVQRINTVFPHWFCERHRDYNANESALPVDQHMLIALMAPRPVYIASAVEDRWADPRGEFLSGFHAQPVWRLFDLPAMNRESPEWPPIDTPIGDHVGYHVRSGKHDVTEYDWEQFMRFANKHLQRKP